MHQRLRFWILLALTGVLAACGSAAPIRLYEGQQRSATQIAVLSMPEALEVARINSAEIQGLGGMLRGGDRVLELAPGRYELLIFYREIWDQTGNHEVLRSDPALFVLEAQPGHRYGVDFERPRQFAQAARLADDFKGWIVDLADGQRVQSQASGLKFAGGMMGGLTGSLALEPLKPDGRPHTQAAVAPLPDSAVAARSAVAKDGGYPDLMRAWWRAASVDERREFLHWLGEQPQ